MRIILFTGKGGVGKTTTAAATAIQCANLGKKTLVISTDPAHSLSDAMDMDLAPEPLQVSENLWCMEFDVYYSMKKYWGNMKEMMRAIFKFQGVDNVIADELSVLPGMEEGAAFLWLEKFYRDKTFDVIVIDSAPTGETLTLLSLPQVTKSWLTKAFPGQKFAIKTLGKVVRTTTGIPLDKGYDEMQNLFDKLEFIQQVFLDPEVTSIRIVANPERMVVQEAKRAYSYLQLYGYNVDGVVVNRIIPPVEDDWLKTYIHKQHTYLEEIQESFEPIPIFKVPHQGDEVFGMKLLEKIGHSIYHDQDPASVFHQEKPIEVTNIQDGYQIKLRIPFIKNENFELRKFGDELIIDINNRRKSMFLPKFANYMQLVEHSYKEPFLTVTLKKI
ncbi:MAG: TRC40/GET3/ArsA family transport-energizing ATPase [Flavobacteriales bacterium]|nr:TRC40/GET3/ArsA family transport-energizing ATPase [Flavobacteriales bacterium]